MAAPHRPPGGRSRRTSRSRAPPHWPPAVPSASALADLGPASPPADLSFAASTTLSPHGRSIAPAQRAGSGCKRDEEMAEVRRELTAVAELKREVEQIRQRLAAQEAAAATQQSVPPAESQAKQAADPLALKVLNTAVVICLYAGVVAVGTKLLNEWLSEGRHPSTSVEVRKVTSLPPPFMTFLATHTLGSCQITDITCSFCRDCEVTRDNIPCSDAAHIWPPTCRQLGLGPRCKREDCVRSPTCDVQYLQGSPWVLNQTLLRELDVELRGTSEEVSLVISVDNLTECFAFGDTWRHGLHIVAFVMSDSDKVDNLVRNLALGSEDFSGDLLQHASVPMALGLGQTAQVLFMIRHEVLLDGTTKNTTLSSVTQFPSYQVPCVDDPRGIYPSLKHMTCDEAARVPGECADNLTASFCSKSCGFCTDPAKPVVRVLMRASNLEMVTTVWKEGQSFVDLLGGVFGWLGVFTGACMHSLWTWFLARVKDRRLRAPFSSPQPAGPHFVELAEAIQTGTPQ
eukprot:TRINITY_DN14322_c0_g1_i2.p1 TRINITY_DN14322_c0_g1~~TRINITY_DN14322_c0_g1_i2.p1  ORF type:complete len:531 (+),score=143.68 TRINITY_DN14322_c0_g1_i2:52-1593(+)